MPILEDSPSCKINGSLGESVPTPCDTVPGRSSDDDQTFQQTLYKHILHKHTQTQTFISKYDSKKIYIYNFVSRLLHESKKPLRIFWQLKEPNLIEDYNL